MSVDFERAAKINRMRMQANLRANSLKLVPPKPQKNSNAKNFHLDKKLSDMDLVERHRHRRL